MTLFHVIIVVIGAGVGAGLGALFGISGVVFCGMMGALIGFVFSFTPWFWKTVDWIFKRKTSRHGHKAVIKHEPRDH
jgi:hypothetical protein